MFQNFIKSIEKKRNKLKSTNVIDDLNNMEFLFDEWPDKFGWKDLYWHLFVKEYRVKDLWHQIDYWLQRRKRGWDERDLWSLDWSFTKFILPVLEDKIFDYYWTNDRDHQKLNEYVDMMMVFYLLKQNILPSTKTIEGFKQRGLWLFLKIVIEHPYVFGRNVCKWWLERLPEFKKNLHGHPSKLSRFKYEDGMEAWKRIIDKIYNAFEIALYFKHTLIDFQTVEETEEYKREMLKGFAYWVKYYENLWD